MFQSELLKLNPIKTNILFIHILLCIIAISASYYLDKAIMISFGVIPALFVWMYRKKLNINYKNTPSFHFLTIGLMSLFLMCSFLLAYFKHA